MSAAPALCKNCGAELRGRYCANCSQAANVHVPSTKELLHELLEGLTHSDSRLWLTLKALWFKPGWLTQEYVAGRRVAYLPPFRLYLVLSLIFFLILSLSHNRVKVIPLDRSAAAETAVAASRGTHCDAISAESFGRYAALQPRAVRVCREIARDNGENFSHLMFGVMSKAMFIFLPLVAFLHMLLYWRPRFRYAEHLLFFAHIHAFYFSVGILILAISAAEAIPKLAGAAGTLETALGCCLPVYTVLSMRRVFKRGWGGSLLKAFALFIVYLVLYAITMGGVVLVAAMQL